VKLTAAQRRALLAVVERGPIPAVHGVVRWRLVDQPWTIMSIGLRDRAHGF